MAKKDSLKEQRKTLKDVREKLKEKHKVIILRCTGFGKTYLATDIIKDYKKVLYVYPAEIIKSTVEERYDQINGNKNELDEDDSSIDAETVEYKYTQG